MDRDILLQIDWGHDVGIPLAVIFGTAITTFAIIKFASWILKCFRGHKRRHQLKAAAKQFELEDELERAINAARLRSIPNQNKNGGL